MILADAQFLNLKVGKCIVIMYSITIHMNVNVSAPVKNHITHFLSIIHIIDSKFTVYVSLPPTSQRNNNPTSLCIVSFILENKGISNILVLSIGKAHKQISQV